MEVIYWIVLLVIPAITTMVWVIYDEKQNEKKRIREQKEKEFRELVVKNSKLIANGLKINKKYDFYDDIKNKYEFKDSCSSKAKLDRLDIDEYLLNLMNDDLLFWCELITYISCNRMTYEEYRNEWNCLESEMTQEECEQLNINYNRFLLIEEQIFNSYRKTAKTNTTIVVHLYYRTPAGKNYYWKEKKYDFDDIEQLFVKLETRSVQKELMQNQIKIERPKMSDSLRYDILKRDGFKCQICGASKTDGVKLHVDHIIPVSKGGKTIYSNLRTLCDRCNLGKRDKI